MPLNPNYQSIEYQSRTKLLDLAEKAATTSKKDKKAKYLQQAAKIRYFLKATALGTSYLTVDQLNNIYQCLIVTTGIQDFPVAPNLPSVSVPSIGSGPAGAQGVSITSVANIGGDLIVYLSNGTTINAGPLPAGADGNSGYIPFALNGATTGTVDVDTFDYSLSKGVRWDYILDNGSSRRIGSVYTTWLDDGTILSQPLEFHSDSVGTAEADTQVTFDANISGSFITLQATIASSTWSIQGLRYYIPANSQTSGSGTSVLPNGQILIGNGSDEAQARSVSGAITISNTGVTTLGSSIVSNSNVASGAAISVNKLAALTADRITKTDASGFLTVTALTESAISSAISSIAGKQNTITGAATTITTSNLTPSSVLVSDGSGKVGVSARTSTDLTNMVTGDSVSLRKKVVTIGDWNMDTNATITVTHGLVNFKTIREISIIVRNDSDTIYHDFLNTCSISGASCGWIASSGITSTSIFLQRLDTVFTGIFDSPAYASTGFNRGWITITYLG